ncbi:ribosomal protein S12 [Ordospora colligata]|uniref:Ribosomal protein S12 n=1 Tax=Ordospora colligata OC4 TaxID=1354746 RepID=A0A0B2UM47_9MICR|nr:ribosomal protein S12 [Ordospora colligata OC4]KHN70428.1 ribosomal protein S12 [Ordospora colligata OC4]TBU17178.1 ribosomal protein S12 [Ordospora colligata]TBU17428.1 ribosomal protein S12 [Ordospora colligata]TBU19608.1 ribosomal protein S12 [Ordospora colligata]
MSEVQELMVEPEKTTTIEDALKKVCMVSRTYCKLSKGTKETLKKILSGQMRFVMLAKDADQKIKTIVMDLASKANVPVVLIETRADLGKIVGVVEINEEGKSSGGKGCSVAGVQDYCEQTMEAGFVQAALLTGVLSK